MRENSKYGMLPPKTRREFEHNVFLLIESSNRIIASNKDDLIDNFIAMTYPHVKNIQKHQNGRINFLTINEQARLQANMQKWMGDMNK